MLVINCINWFKNAIHTTTNYPKIIIKRKKALNSVSSVSRSISLLKMS